MRSAASEPQPSQRQRATDQSTNSTTQEDDNGAIRRDSASVGSDASGSRLHQGYIDDKQGSTIDLIWTLRMATPRKTVFRPCIDLHDGRVKQIVGGTLSDHDRSGLKTNFISKSVVFLNLL